MASMSPILRMRRAFRQMGAEPEQADEAADAIEEHSYGRRESDLRHAQMMSEFRQNIAELRNQMLLGMVLIVGVATAIITIAIAVFD